MSGSPIEPAFRDAAAWGLLDANVRLGPSGVHGGLALESSGLLAEMDRFGIGQALVSHLTAQEYDAQDGNRALARDIEGHPDRLIPAWSALPEKTSLDQLDRLKPCAARLSFGAKQHNASYSLWCAGPLYEFLEAHSIVAVIAREDMVWDHLEQLLRNFPRLPVLLLEVGYRSERFLGPMLKAFSQLVLDSSTLLAHRQLECFVEKYGAERIVFGSRLPFYTPGAALAVLGSARISDGARCAIAGGTLRRLLQIKEP